jgi:hypothetical protein
LQVGLWVLERNTPTSSRATYTTAVVGSELETVTCRRAVVHSRRRRLRDAQRGQSFNSLDYTWGRIAYVSAMTSDLVRSRPRVTSSKRPAIDF